MAPLEVQSWERTVEEILDAVLTAGVVWLSATDEPTVAVLRDALEDYRTLRADQRTAPKELREARKEITGLLSQLGFDPTARSRLGLAEVKANESAAKIERLRSR